jgi:PadR family transcriptional regulator, regulatory protein PadR
MGRPKNTSLQTRLLLAKMLEHPRAWHFGYELSKATGLTSGTLYPLLIRLSDRGLLDSRWQAPEREGRPPRHAYRLNALGAELARDAESAMTGTQAIGRRSGATA